MLLTSANQRTPAARPRKARARPNRILIELRLNQGRTPNDLGLAAGVSGNTVRAAERGHYVDPRSQFSICSVLGVDVLTVFPFERQKEAK